MRSRLALLPSKRQTVGEAVYELAQTQIAEQGLPAKAIGTWFPYVASLFLFIWTMNTIGFIPLPLTGQTWHGVPTWGIYAVTSQLSVTLVLALFSVVFTHVEGLRWNGIHYFKSFVPAGVPKPMVPFMALLETISHVFRVVSLSVRLYANMLAGHMLILVSIGLIFILKGITFYIVGPDLVSDRNRLLRVRARHRRHHPGVHLRCADCHLHRLGDRAGALRLRRCLQCRPEKVTPALPV